MPKRLPYEVLICAALALGSCQDEQTSRRLDLAEINLRRAAAASRAMVNRVERIEARLDEVESQLDRR
jgi:hypothetical protein